MKFFSRAFIHGTMGERQRRARVAGYERLLSNARLSSSLAKLARLYMHDARVLAFKYEPDDGTLLLRVCRGDLQVGYFDVSLRFGGVRISPAGRRVFRAATLDEGMEVLEAELLPHRHQFKYCLLFRPRGEASFTFECVRITSRAVSSREGRLRR